MTPELWAEIRRLSKVEELAKSEIARRLRINRRTVTHALTSETVPPIRGPLEVRRSHLDPYKPFIQKRLVEFPRISAVRLLAEIKGQGYPGGLTVLKDYLGTLRPRLPEAFLRIETQPGEQAQVDWAHCGAIQIGSTWRKVSLFVMVLSWSRLMYAEFCLSQCLEDFLGAHWRAFQFFGGLPRKCLYDNLKSVVLARFGSEIRFNPRFMEFSGACLFEPRLCRPAHGNEKGKVESGIKYARSSFLDGRVPCSWPQMQMDLSDWLKGTANVRLHGTTRVRPIDRFELEKPLLHPLPEHAPDTDIVRAVKATSQGLVKFDGNQYSVPSGFAGQVLTLRAERTEIKLYSGIQRLAVHTRSFERGVVVENPAHYAGLLAARKAAHHAKSHDQFLALGRGSPAAQGMVEAYLEGLVQSELQVFHHLRQILEMAGVFGRTEILQALAKALEFKAFGAPSLQNIVTQQRVARGLAEKTPIVIPAKPEWTQAVVEEQDLQLYDDLFETPSSERKIP
jgi:transposase